MSSSEKTSKVDPGSSPSSESAFSSFTIEELWALEAECSAALDPELSGKVTSVISTLVTLLDKVIDKGTTIHKLRSMLFGKSSEKSSARLDQSSGERNTPKESPKKKRRRKGHGRNGAKDHTGAEVVHVPNDEVESGQRCPCCERGKIYPYENGQEVRFKGQSPIAVTRYELSKHRCQQCGHLFSAKMPSDAGDEKYDKTVVSTIATLKYGASMPLYRLERLLEGYGILLSDGTMSDLLKREAANCQPLYDALTRHAAQGGVLYIDDTTNRIIKPPPVIGDRTGLFTTGILSVVDSQEVVLYLTGRKHAGENLEDVLQHRLDDLPQLIRVADALSSNNVKNLDLLPVNCMAHARRKFVDLLSLFPTECHFVIETIGAVYQVDDKAKKQKLSPRERLERHQRESRPLMEQLQEWCDKQFTEKLVEPNSSLGKAIKYLKNNWTGLTEFLRTPGAPLDNNAAERILRLVVLCRKNYLFYRTQKGAAVGDTFMSLIATCRANGVDPFRYLTLILRNAEAVAANPEQWFPWLVREKLASL